MVSDDYDIAIIGAGIVGLSIAYNLSKYRVACIEKEGMIATGASGNNSGVIHSGINLKPGSMKARFCVEGSNMIYELCEKFNVPYKRSGTLVIATDDEGILDELMKRAKENNVRDVRIIDERQLKSIEPNVKGKAALLSPNGGVTDSKRLCYALRDVSVKNGLDLILNSKVTAINDRGSSYKIIFENEKSIKSRIVVNSAGLYADEIAAMVGAKYKIYPWLGAYFEIEDDLINTMIYPPPIFGAPGLGIHLTRTIYGKILVGPNAIYMQEKDKLPEVNVEEFYDAASRYLSIKKEDLRYSYAGIRAKLSSPENMGEKDFVIEEYPKNFINLIGIESPGFTASPAIAKYVCKKIESIMDLRTNN